MFLPHRSPILRFIPAVLPTLGLFAGCGGDGSSGDSRTVDASPAQPTDSSGPPAQPSGTRDGSRTPRDSSEPEPIPGEPGLQLIGRFDLSDPLGPKCAWPGCRVIARFFGTEVSVKLREIDEAWMEGGPSEWDVAIDGTWQPKLVLSNGATVEYPLASGLAHGTHVVELYKRSEAQNGMTQLVGFDFRDGKLLPPPPRKTRRLEIVGDSAVAGFGIEGVGLGPDCPGVDWASHWQNFRLSAGARLGELLDAEVAGTVYSGKGVAQNIWWTDPDTLPTLFKRAIPLDKDSTWSFQSYVPQVVVVVMGGNDFAIGLPSDRGPATLATFTDTYDAFVASVRQVYADAHVFLVASPSLTDEFPPDRQTRTNVSAGIAGVVSRRQAAGDARVHEAKPSLAVASELTACNGHGTPEFHQRVAQELAAVVRLHTGW